MTETPENRLKRLKIRSWRRGIKEMDLILGTFADAMLGQMDATTLDMYEALLEENDQDLYPWFTGLVECPPEHRQIFDKIKLEGKYR